MKVIKITNKKAIRLASNFLNEGGLIICPTDTVYGFLADATNKKAVDKIYKVKKRPKNKPLPVFIGDLKGAEDLAVISGDNKKTINKYWPGKYTLVFNRRTSKIYGVDKKTIALRIPKHTFLKKLLKKINKPLAQTSVNISGGVALNKIGDILTEFSKAKDILIIDGGSLAKNRSSTILDLTGKKIKILRK